VVDGIPAVLGELGEQHRLAVATSKPLAFAEPLLVALDLRGALDHVAAPDLGAYHEDKAATIRSALHALGTQRAVMVGDRSFDIIGAHACDIRAIGVSWGIGTRDELADANADRIVGEPGELPGVVGDLLA
jgi:phosphoglycolate phosphatase